MIYSIYKFVNNLNQKVYIGYTQDWDARYQSHLAKYPTNDTALYGAIRKYGIENFTAEVVYQSLDKDHTLNVMEEYFIREYNSHVDHGHGYNQTYGGDGMVNPSEEVRYKIGSANRGKKRGPWSEEVKRKIGFANSQKTRTEEEKQHLRNINLGKKQSEKTILKHSKSYIVTSPEGVTFSIVNLSRFCKENNLNGCIMGRMARGQINQLLHKGWRCKKAD